MRERLAAAMRNASQEFLLLERRGDGFCLVRGRTDGTRAEFPLTRADLLCLSAMTEAEMRAWDSPRDRPTERRA
ncbi:MAG: hypothetical protein AB7S57_13835 [Acetobacteraceae bacterium]